MCIACILRGEGGKKKKEEYIEKIKIIGKIKFCQKKIGFQKYDKIKSKNKVISNKSLLPLTSNVL